jgi:hypothetical protein
MLELQEDSRNKTVNRDKTKKSPPLEARVNNRPFFITVHSSIRMLKKWNLFNILLTKLLDLPGKISRAYNTQGQICAISLLKEAVEKLLFSCGA